MRAAMARAGPVRLCEKGVTALKDAGGKRLWQPGKGGNASIQPRRAVAWGRVPRRLLFRSAVFLGSGGLARLEKRREVPVDDLAMRLHGLPKTIPVALKPEGFGQPSACFR